MLRCINTHDICFHTVEKHFINTYVFWSILSDFFIFPGFPSFLPFNFFPYYSCILVFNTAKSFLSSYPLTNTHPSSFSCPTQHSFESPFSHLSLPFTKDILLFCKQAERASKNHRIHLLLFLTIAQTSENRIVKRPHCI